MCPGLPGVGLLDFGSRRPLKEPCPCRSVTPRIPPQSARPGGGRPPDRSDRCRSGYSDQTIYGWRKQELIDTGQLPGLNRAEQAELAAANKRIRELETEVAILKRARELLREPHDPKGGTRP